VELFLKSLWETPWWVYEPATVTALGLAYRCFNLIEGLFWVGFAALVAKRWWHARQSWLEVAYALAFFVFGLTDFREAYVQSAPLVLAKGIVLALLWWLRRTILQRYYPNAWF